MRDLAYKDLLPDQILRAQHAQQTLQDHLTEQHMRQLLGSEPLQAILGVICQKEQRQQNKQYKDNHCYIQMIDSMDPVAALQPLETPKEEGKEKTEKDTTGEAAVQRKTTVIVAEILLWKQQNCQQRRLTTIYKDNNDNNDDNGAEGEGSTTRRRVETPRRQEDTTTAAEMAIVERRERERERGSTTGKETKTTTSLCCYYDNPSLPRYSDYLSFTHHVHYIAVYCSATTGSIQLPGLETRGEKTTVGVQLHLPTRHLVAQIARCNRDVRCDSNRTPPNH